MGNKYLKGSESISDKTDIGVDIYYYVHPETRRVETAWMYSPLGVDEWDFSVNTWEPLDGTDPRGLKWQRYVVYKVDWSNPEDAEGDDELKTLNLYKKKELTEEDLKVYAKLVHDEFGRNPEL